MFNYYSSFAKAGLALKGGLIGANGKTTIELNKEDINMKIMCEEIKEKNANNPQRALKCGLLGSVTIK